LGGGSFRIDSDINPPRVKARFGAVVVVPAPPFVIRRSLRIVSEPETDYERALGWWHTVHLRERNGALSGVHAVVYSKVVDTAGIVRDVMLRQLFLASMVALKFYF
jgi:hypothetical protein